MSVNLLSLAAVWDNSSTKMGVFWGREGTRGTPGAPLEAVLERVLILGRFLGAFWEALEAPLAPLGSPGDPSLAIFQPRGRHFAAPGRHPRSVKK